MKTKQKRLTPTILDWEKIYVNYTKNIVLIFKDKEKTELERKISIKEFDKMLKRVPSITNLIIMYLR